MHSHSPLYQRPGFKPRRPVIMAPRLVKLLRQEQGKESNEFFPPLPVRRKSLVEINPVSPSTAESPFFQHLPSEIRNLILVYAFGGRTVHMDLIPRYRKRRKPRRSTAREPRSSHERTVSDLRGWALWGGVCDRTASSQGIYYAGFRLHLDQPTEDTCRRPHASWWKEYIFPRRSPDPATSALWAGYWRAVVHTPRAWMCSMGRTRCTYAGLICVDTYRTGLRRLLCARLLLWS